MRSIMRDPMFYTARCRTACHNGGTCTRENQCRCPVGYTGNFCQRRESRYFLCLHCFFHEPLGVLIPNLSKNQPPRIGTFISVTAITLQCTVYVRFLSEQLASYA